MNLIIIIGAQAAGKMTVGSEISKVRDYVLFHNHMSIEMPLKLFEYDSPGFKALNSGIREIVFNEMMAANRNFIFTYMCAFNVPEDLEYLNNLIEKFENEGHSVYVLELISNLATRLDRNKTEFRLTEKPSKADLKRSSSEMASSVIQYTLESQPGDLKGKHHLKIVNDNHSAKEVATTFLNTFNL